MHALSPTTVWFVGEGGTAVGTKDGGATWIFPNTNMGGGSRIVDFTFVSEQVGHAVGDNSNIVRTTDGGATWTSQLSGDRARVGDNRILFEGVSFLNETTGLAVGATGLSMWTRDGGDTWEAPEEPLAIENLFGVKFTSESEGWIVGQEATILHTTDAGKSWTRVENAAQEVYVDLYDIAFHPTDPKMGYIVGDGGMILSTMDGGKTWQKEESGVFDALHGVAVNPNGNVFVVGGWGVILWNQPATVAAD